MRTNDLTAPLTPLNPAFVQWADHLGWVPRVAGGAGGGDGDDTEDKTDQDDDGDGDDTEGENGTDQPTLTQNQVDELLKKRLGQAQKQWEKDQKTAADKAAMTETERLKAEKAEADKAAADKSAAADQRVVRSEAKVAAVAAGVKPDRAVAFLKIVDLDGIEIGDDGDPDPAAIKTAVEATLKDVPEFKGTTGGKGPSGSEHDGGPKNKPTNLSDAIAAKMAGN